MNILVWLIMGLSIAGVILRPCGLREVYPAAAGALLLVTTRLLPAGVALRGAGQGSNVYLFLAGMMLLAELGRAQGLFAWAAGLLARRARGSANRLFCMVYGIAVLVTVFLSNDATAVVFTPAVAAMARAVKAERPLPFLLICAFVANAASFVLPISNPANLVVYGSSLPALLPWMARFALPSVFSIAATFLLLWFTQRGALRAAIELPETVPELTQAGRHTGYGLIATAILLMVASGLGVALGPPTLAAAIVLALFVRQPLWNLAKNISWSVLPLVAALFVMVAALDATGASTALGRVMQQASPWVTGIGLGLASNLVNNLPAGLMAGHAALHASAPLRAAALIGVDLGPNLSVTGSLATILWLIALRREGFLVTPGEFLKLGLRVMPGALILALFALVILG